MSIGIVDLRDLDRWSAWEPLQTPRFVAAAGLALEQRFTRRFAPPRVAVAIFGDDDDLRDRFTAWLAAAEHVVPVRVPAAGIDPAIAAEALARARALARTLPPRSPERTVAAEAVELPLSPWSRHHGLPSYALLPELVARIVPPARLVIEEARTIDLADLPPEIVFTMPPRRTPEEVDTRGRTLPGRQRLGRDPAHPVSWRGDRMYFHWIWEGADRSGYLGADEHDFPCGPAKKLWGHADNDPVEILLAPPADFVVARFEHDVELTSAVPVAWQAAGDLEVAAFRPDPQRAVLFSRAAEGPWFTDDLLDEDARELAPVVVAGPDARARYAVDLRDVVHRVERRGREAIVSQVGGPDEGFAVFDAAHRLVRRASGRLLGGWFRWATVEADGAYFREDLATGARARIGPVDMWLATDAADEAVARDAIVAGRPDAALAIHRSRPSRDVSAEEPAVLAIPGTRNVLLVCPDALRVV